MQSTKAWAALISLFVFMAFCAVWTHLDRVDRANSAFLDSRILLEGTRTAFESKKRSLETRKQTLESHHRTRQESESALKEAERRLVEATALQTSAKVKETGVRAGIREASAALSEAIETKRLRAMSKVHPYLTLRSQKTFSDVRIHKIDDNSIRFQHSTGTNTVEAWELPDSLQEELDIGPKSLMQALKEFEDSLDGRTDVPAEPVAAVPMPKRTLSEAEKSNLLVMKTQLSELGAKMRTVSADITRYQQIATRSEQDAMDAKFRGVPSWNYAAAAQNARAAAAQGQNFLISAQAEYERLSSRINDMESMLR